MTPDVPTPSPSPGATSATLIENRKRAEEDARSAGQVQTSHTGAVIGRPDAEHSMYGMRREGSPDSEDVGEREIRGVEPEQPAPKT